MNASNEPIRLYEVGEFGQLSARPNPDDLIIQTVPPFDAMLSLIANRMGRELTLDEIETERQRAPSIVLTRTEVEKMNAARAQSR